MKLKHFIALFIVVLLFVGSGCGSSSSNLASITDNTDNQNDNQTDNNTNNQTDNNTNTSETLTSADIEITKTLTATGSNTHAILASADTSSYSHLGITKTGDSSGEESDFYGTNAAVLASNGAVLTLTDSLVVTDGAYANGVFSYGSGTTVNVTDSVIITRSNNSGGIMTTGGGTMNAANLTIETSAGSSAAIRSDRGGGTVSVNGGSYTTSGTGSPAIYSTADIAVSNAYLESKTAQGVVIEGKNSVTLNNSQLVANHNKFNGQDSSYQGVMIYQSGSGDASDGKGEFTISGGSITNANGAVFFVTNTAADITLNNTDIENNDSEGVLLRAESAAWGSSGSNGGKVNFYAVDQTLTGDFLVDGDSVLNLYVSGDSVFTGTINGSSEVSSAAGSSSSEGQVYVELNDSTWILTGESNITSLTCGTGSVNLNGYTLYVNGTAYTSGTASTGTAIEISSGNSSGNSENSSGDDRPGAPGGNTSGDNGPGGNPPDSSGPGGESDTDSGSNDTSMSFANASYTTSTVNNVTYRAYTNLVYVSKPVNETYQRMNVYIPETYFSGGTINGYSASTAPIFMPNGVGGYSKASAMSPSSSNSLGLALQNGLVVASPALRGRDSDYGTAPACIVDYKAAVRYLRTAGLPAGNTDRIISSGTSAGGAISSLLGAAGNSPDYDEWLDELGAANASDDIFASMCYCPITNLDNADGAYEWTFGSGSDASEELAANFITYLNGLNLGYSLNSDGTGTFADYLESLGISLSTYGATRDKSQIPAFDRLDLSSAENIEFGNAHFTEYGYNHNTASSNAMADSAVIKAMNPMNYIGSATTAKYWRIRHGTEDRDTSLAIPAILALKLEKEGFDVDFAAASGERHGGDYDLEELFDWINNICK
ncbi:MAG: hypothetical protein IJS39_03960 [Synergistaceae bacterium]|nr:hypothetical protein [Synergistaceae bacterium]